MYMYYMSYLATYIERHNGTALSERVRAPHQSQHNFISNVALNQFVLGSYSLLRAHLLNILYSVGLMIVLNMIILMSVTSLKIFFYL